MFNGKIAAQVAPDVIYAEAQFQRPAFQIPCLDEKSGHASSESKLTLHAWRTQVERKINPFR
jgi:hypothetical protein